MQDKRYSVRHRTVYAYDREVTIAPHYIRLKPLDDDHIHISNYQLSITPQPTLYWTQDVIGNHMAKCLFTGMARELCVTSSFDVALEEKNPFSFIVDEYAENYPFTYRSYESTGLQHYLVVEEKGRLFDDFFRRFANHKLYIISMLSAVANEVAMQIRYVKRDEPGHHSAEETLALKEGSCRDTAWLLLQTLRALGLATRFVSGYLLQTEENESVEVEYHAWVECYIPGAGWVGIDPTSGMFTTEYHIALACDARPENTMSVIGTTSPCMATLRYELECSVIT